MLNFLSEWLLAHWQDLLPEILRPSCLGFSVLSSSRLPEGTRIVLVFPHRATVPVLAVKVPRDPSRTQALEWEWECLSVLGSQIPADLIGLIPRSLLRGTVAGMPVYAQTAVQGYNLKTLIQQQTWPLPGRNVQRDLDALEGWLDLFQAVHPVPSTEMDRWLSPDEPIDKVCATLESIPDLSGKDLRRLQDYLGPWRAVSGSRKQCWVHGDLWPGNVLVAGSRWSVLDWDGVSVGDPLVDRFWFALHYGALCWCRGGSRRDLREGLLEMLFGTSRIAVTVREYLRHSAARSEMAGLSGPFLASLLVRGAGRSIKGTAGGRVFDREAPTWLGEWLRRPYLAFGAFS